MLLPLEYADAEAIVSTYLKSVLPDVPVHVHIPTTRPTRFVHIRRSGGVTLHGTDRPRIDIWTWAATDEAAKDLAQLVKRHLGDIPGTRSGWQVTRVTDFAGLAPAPDQSASARWTFSIELFIRGKTP